MGHIHLATPINKITNPINGVVVICYCTFRLPGEINVRGVRHTAIEKSNCCRSVDSPRTAIHGGTPDKCNMQQICTGLLRMLVAVAVAVAVAVTVAVAVSMVEGLCPIVNGKMLQACQRPYLCREALPFYFTPSR
jgi:hypothetical protein